MVVQSRPKSRSCAPARPIAPSLYYSTHHSPRILFSSPVICITWRHISPVSQQLPHTSCHHRVYTSRAQIFSASVPARPAGEPDWVGAANPMFSAVCRLFIASLRSFRTRFPCFHRLQTLLPKHPGWGYLRSILWGAALPGGASETES